MAEHSFDNEALEEVWEEARKLAESLNSKQSIIASKEKLSVWKDESDSSLNNARRKFLKTIKDEQQKVLSSLYKNVFPIYRPLYVICGPHYLTRWYILNSYAPAKKIKQIILEQLKMLSRPISNSLNNQHREKVLEKRTQISAALSELIKYCNNDYEYSHSLINLLKDWSKHSHLQDDWLLDYALQTLALWSEAGVPEELDWQYQLTGVYSFELAQPFQFEYRAWKPEIDTWSSYRRKLDAAYKTALKAYRSESSPSTKPKLAYDCSTDEHFLWLVKYQVGELSAEDLFANYEPLIFAEVKDDRATLRDRTKKYLKAIRELAKFIGLSVHKIPPGRPRL
jgi:hypothetical protein